MVLRDSQNNLSAEARSEIFKLKAEVASLQEQLSEAKDTIKILKSGLSDTSYDTLQIIRDLPVFLWVKDRDSNVIYVSKRGSEVFGLSPQDMEGRSSYELYPEDATKYYKDDLDVMESGLPKLAIIEHITLRDGKKLWVSTDKYPWRNSLGEIIGVIALAFDVTERVIRIGQAPEKLQTMDLTLMEAEHRSYLAFRGTQDGLWDLRLDRKKPYVSGRCKEIVGFKDNEIGDDFFQWMERIHPEDREANRAALIAHFKHKVPYDIEFRFKNKDGYYRWISCHGQAEWDEAGVATRICGSIRDVTDRKVTEHILRTQYNISTAFNNVHNMATFKSVSQQICNAIDWSDGAVWLYSNDDIQLSFHFGKQVELYKVAIDTESRELILDCIRDGKVFAGDTDRQHRTGTRLKFAYRLGLGHQLIFPLRSGNRIIGAFELFHKDPREYRDDLRQWTEMLGSQLGGVLDRVMIQNELIERDMRLNSIVDGAPDGIITICDGAVFSANAAAHEMFGYEGERMIGLSAEEIMPGISTRVFEFLTKANEKNQGNFAGRFEIQAKKHNDGVLPIEAAISVFSINDVIHMTVIIRDISERKEVEKRVSEFYSMVSHELRTPLTSIRGSLGLLEGGLAGELSPMASKLVTVGKTEAERLIRLINDILDIRKIQAGRIDLKRSTHKVGELMHDAIEAIKPIADSRKIEIVKNIDEEIIILCDRDRVIQVLTNILSNAIKYSPDEAKVVLTAHKLDEKVLLTVKDNGPGIPIDKIGELFVPFHQIDSEMRLQGGTGLGLVISKAIVTHHGGTIGVESEPGQGATFWFELPVE